MRHQNTEGQQNGNNSKNVPYSWIVGILLLIAFLLFAYPGPWAPGWMPGHGAGVTDDQGASLFKDQAILKVDGKGQLTDGNYTAMKIGGAYKLVQNDKPAAPVTTNTTDDKFVVIGGVAYPKGTSVPDSTGATEMSFDVAIQNLKDRKGISYDNLADRIDVSKDMNAPTLKADKDNTFTLPTESEFKAIYKGLWNNDFEAATNNGIVRSTLKTTFGGDKVPTIGTSKDLKTGYGLVKSDDTDNMQLKCIKVTANENKEVEFNEAGSADNGKTAYAVNQKLE
jgi:hypothetical protein